MAQLPLVLKMYELHVNGRALGKKAKAVTIPKLARKMEDWRAGGMSGSIGIDLGLEPLSMEFTVGGAEVEFIKQFGSRTAEGVLLRFSGAYRSDDSATVNAVEIVTRCRYSEIDFGAQTTGEVGETKVIAKVAYVKYTLNNQTLLELDPLSGIEIVNGEDLTADVRAAIGLSY